MMFVLINSLSKLILIYITTDTKKEIILLFSNPCTHVPVLPTKILSIKTTSKNSKNFLKKGVKTDAKMVKTT